MFSYNHSHPEIRDAVSKLCEGFDGKYWQRCDAERAYPSEFVKALTDAGYLSALVPEEFGGLSLPISAGAAILEEVHRSGGNAAAAGNRQPVDDGHSFSAVDATTQMDRDGLADDHRWPGHHLLRPGPPVV